MERILKTSKQHIMLLHFHLVYITFHKNNKRMLTIKFLFTFSQQKQIPKIVDNFLIDWFWFVYLNFCNGLFIVSWSTYFYRKKKWRRKNEKRWKFCLFFMSNVTSICILLFATVLFWKLAVWTDLKNDNESGE